MAASLDRFACGVTPTVPDEAGDCKACGGTIYDYEHRVCETCGADVHQSCIERCEICGHEGCRACLVEDPVDGFLQCAENCEEDYEA